MTHKIRRVSPNNITPPIESLEYYFRAGGVTLIQAAFSHSFFVDPDSVREKTPMYPDRARYSRTHYPGLSKGKSATWSGDGRSVVLDDNQYAQNAWQRYSGCPIQRGSGYSLRHVWGQPWDPDAFTAGWNFCYMPFWAGMLTEEQHLLKILRDTIRQASWELYFQDNPVGDPPDFVNDPGVDLEATLGDQPLLVMCAVPPRKSDPLAISAPDTQPSASDPFGRVSAIRSQRHQSWLNLYKGVLALQQKAHEPFGTPNVQAGAMSDVRKILREVGLKPAELQSLLERESPVLGQSPKSAPRVASISSNSITVSAPSPSDFDKVKAIRAQRHQSWSNIYKATLAIQWKEHEPFGTAKVEASAMSDLRKILRETDLSPAELQSLLEHNTQVSKQT